MPGGEEAGREPLVLGSSFPGAAFLRLPNGVTASSPRCSCSSNNTTDVLSLRTTVSEYQLLPAWTPSPKPNAHTHPAPGLGTGSTTCLSADLGFELVSLGISESLGLCAPGTLWDNNVHPWWPRASAQGTLF